MTTVGDMFAHISTQAKLCCAQANDYIFKLDKSGKMEIEDPADFEKMLFTAAFAASIYNNGEKRRKTFNGQDITGPYKWEVFNGDSSRVVENLCYNYMRGNRTVTKGELTHIKGVCVTLAGYIHSMETRGKGVE